MSHATSWEIVGRLRRTSQSLIMMTSLAPIEKHTHEQAHEHMSTHTHTRSETRCAIAHTHTLARSRGLRALRARLHAGSAPLPVGASACTYLGLGAQGVVGGQERLQDLVELCAVRRHDDVVVVVVVVSAKSVRCDGWMGRASSVGCCCCFGVFVSRDAGRDGRQRRQRQETRVRSSHAHAHHKDTARESKRRRIRFETCALSHAHTHVNTTNWRAHAERERCEERMGDHCGQCCGVG